MPPRLAGPVRRLKTVTGAEVLDVGGGDPPSPNPLSAVAQKHLKR